MRRATPPFLPFYFFTLLPFLPFYPFTLLPFPMLTSALIHTAFIADTLRRPVLVTTVNYPVPHRVVRLVPPSPSDILSRPLRPYARKQTTARGLQVAIPSYIRPMAVKYPPQKKHR